MPTNMRLHYSPEIFDKIREPANVQTAIEQVMAMNGLSSAAMYAEARRFVLMKMLELGQTTNVVAYLLGSGLLGRDL